MWLCTIAWTDLAMVKSSTLFEKLRKASSPQVAQMEKLPQVCWFRREYKCLEREGPVIV
jgi:hypothetical protein